MVLQWHRPTRHGNGNVDFGVRVSHQSGLPRRHRRSNAFLAVSFEIRADRNPGMLSNLDRPNGAIEGWCWGAAVAPVMLICAIAVELVTEPEVKWLARLVGHNSRTCLTVIPLLSVGPLLCFFVALRAGAPRAPGFAGAIAGVAASGIGATFYAANCTDDSPLFVATWYPLAVLMVSVVGCFGGRLLLRW